MPDLKYYMCWAEGQDPKVPEKALLDWWCSDDKQYHCIFCGEHGSFLTTDPRIKREGKLIEFQYCCRCKEYKGIEPCIPGYCPFGEE